MLGLKKKTRKIKRWLAGCLVEILALFVNRIPEHMARRVGTFIGWMSNLFALRGHRRITENLQLVYGDSMSQKQQKELSRKIFINLCQMAAEAAQLITLTSGEVKRKVEPNDDIVRMMKSIEKGRSVMIVTGHYGNWELLAAYVASFAPLTVLARRNDNPKIENLIQRIRTTHHIRILDRSDSRAPRELIRMGKEGGHFLGVLMDQDTTRIQGVFSEFMGISALTPIGPASLAIRDDFDVFVAYLRPIGDGRHKLMANGPIPIPDLPDRSDQIQKMTDIFNHYLSQMIFDDPQFWVWNHRRWRHRPEQMEVPG